MRNCLNLLGPSVNWQITAGSILWLPLVAEDEKSKWIGADYQTTAMITG